MSQDLLSLILTIAIIVGIFVWPLVLQFLFPPCSRLVHRGLRALRLESQPAGHNAPPSPPSIENSLAR